MKEIGYSYTVTILEFREKSPLTMLLTDQKTYSVGVNLMRSYGGSSEAERAAAYCHNEVGAIRGFWS